MRMREETRRIRLQEWSRIIQDRIESGLTINKYCSEHNISRDAYMYWLRQLRAAEIVRKEGLFTELVVSDLQQQMVVPVSIPVPITITVGKGTITVQDKESLKMVMEVLLSAQ